MLSWARQVKAHAYLAVATDLKEDLLAALDLESSIVRRTQRIAKILAAARSVRTCLYRS